MNRGERKALYEARRFMGPAEVEEEHQQGSRKYGIDWIRANEEAIRILTKRKLDPQEERALGVLIARRLCEWREYGQIEHANLAKPKPMLPSG